MRAEGEGDLHLLAFSDSDLHGRRGDGGGGGGEIRSGGDTRRSPVNWRRADRRESANMGNYCPRALFTDLGSHLGNAGFIVSTLRLEQVRTLYDRSLN